MNDQDTLLELNRRNFLKGGSAATLMTLLGGIPLVMPTRAADAEKLQGPAVKIGVIGLGAWSRDVLAALGKVPEAEIVALCDTYPAAIKRAAGAAPKAEGVADYTKVLANKEIKAVIIATPTHQHKEIALAALQAGKHVYCEAPLAHTVDDARAIAKAAAANPHLVFQPGLQLRSDPQRRFLLDFIRAGAMGKPVKARAQWNKKVSWRYASPNSDREVAINWRLDERLSLGLAGEIGIHQTDACVWFLRERPSAVTGFGSIVNWRDGRTVADTAQAVFQFPNGAMFTFEGTLANSFDSDYEMLYGTEAAVMLRGSKAWMFKEVDAPLLGWEVYARKDQFYRETGIALIANATKLANLQDKATDDAPGYLPPIQTALANFLYNVNEVNSAVEDFVASFGKADPKALQKHLDAVARQPAASLQDGYEATILAIKAGEAVRTGQRVSIEPALYEI